VDDYKPGERIADYLSYFVYADDSMVSRGVSEVEEFGLSKCKRVSGDRMSCMNCHDPHYSPPPEEQAAFYRKEVPGMPHGAEVRDDPLQYESRLHQLSHAEG